MFIEVPFVHTQSMLPQLEAMIRRVHYDCVLEFPQYLEEPNDLVNVVVNTQ